MRAFVALLLALSSLAALAQADYAREQRWAAEITPAILVGDPVQLATSGGRKFLGLYAPNAKARAGVIVVHGLGVHPDWNLIGVLRTELADLGFATLSVQMPVLAADAPRDGYRFLFPDAFERLDSALAWLRERGYANVAVVSHSLGSAMVDEWLASVQPRVDAWVPIGLTVDFAKPPTLPVVDVVAEHDLPEALQFAKVRMRSLRHDACSATLVFAGTDHYFDRAAAALARRIAPFLARALARRC